jgi:hypothetical protein
VLCGSVDERRAGEYMAEVRTSSQSERPCAGIEETRKPPGDAGGSSSPSTETTTQESGLRENRTSRLSERTEEGRKPDLLRLYTVEAG